MKVVELSVSSADRAGFELDEFLSRPLFAHLAHHAVDGVRESPVWFHWDGEFLWIIGGSTFPENLKQSPQCAIGIVDWELATGLCQHVGFRGTADVLAADPNMARKIFRKYFGPDEAEWDPRFRDAFDGSVETPMVCFTPHTVVIRDQSYRATAWAKKQ